ncbi:hypothetical protein ACLOJK_032774 [Asimina triloba]
MTYIIDLVLGTFSVKNRTFSMKKQAEELMHTWPLELLDVVRINADDIIIRIKYILVDKGTNHFTLRFGNKTPTTIKIR